MRRGSSGRSVRRKCGKKSRYFTFGSPKPASRTRLAHRPRPDQHGVLVERAGVHGVPRKRVQRVVLEDEQQPVRCKHATNLAEQRDVLRVRNVVEHARRERDVERRRAVRNRGAVEMRELGLLAMTVRADLEALLRDVEAGHARARQVTCEERHRVADACSEVEHARRRVCGASRASSVAMSMILYSAKYSGSSPRA